MKTRFIQSLKIWGVLTFLLGIIYPIFITGIARWCFHEKADGSLIKAEGRVIGSALIGQTFDSDRYFSSRPSFTQYNPLPSGASNLGLTNTRLRQLVKERKEKFILRNELPQEAEVPSEMIFASGSGLDPHISPEAAILQINRVAKMRGFSEKQKQQLYVLVEESVEMPQFHILGKARVNVFLLNLKLDGIHPSQP